MGRRIGMRLWLGVAFAAVGLITAGTVYLIVRDSSERVLTDRSSELAVGRSIHLADRIGDAKADPGDVIAGATGSGFRAWYFDAQGRLVAPRAPDRALSSIGFRRTAVERALAG